MRKVIIKKVPESLSDEWASNECQIDYGNGVTEYVADYDMEERRMSFTVDCLEKLEKAGIIELVDTRTYAPQPEQLKLELTKN